jgi:hypothetical protein
VAHNSCPFLSYLSANKDIYCCWQKMIWLHRGAILSQNHLVTLFFFHSKTLARFLSRA